MIFADLTFYLFSALALVGAMMVVFARQPVHAVLFLIFVFFNAAALMLLLGAEFAAMLLVIVYVGAVAVLFLFVVMMLPVENVNKKRAWVKNLPLCLAVLAILSAEGYVLLKAVGPAPQAVVGLLSIPDVTNSEALGMVVYTYYVLAFQLAGLVLLVAMIGAIVLTLRKREGVRRQSIAEQVARRPKDAVSVVSVPFRKGA